MFFSPVKSLTARRNNNPRAYKLIDNKGNTKGLLRKSKSNWMLGCKEMHTLFPSPAHARGTSYIFFRTVKAAKQWAATVNESDYF